MASETSQAIKAASSSHRQVAINVASSVGSLAVTVLVGLWYTPYMIRNLGVAVYGLVPLASSITNYLSIVTTSVCTTVARYITVDLARDDVDNANRHFNTFLVIGAIMAAALFLAAAGFSFFLPVFFNIPHGQERDAQLVFLGVAGAFLISTIANTFQSSIWVVNRFEVRSLIEAFLTLLRAALIVVSFRLWAPALWQVSLVIPVIAGTALLADMIACRKLAPSLRVSLSSFDREKLPELWSMGQWLVVSQIGNLLFVNIDLAVINILIGPEAGGRYAPLLQWVVLLRTVMSLVTGTLSPPIVVRYAREDIDGLLRLSRQAAKFLGVILGLPAGLLAGFAVPMLRTWLGPSFVDLAPLTWLLMVPLAVEASQYHLSAIMIAAKELRGPAWASLLFGAGNIGLAVFLTGQLKWGLFGVATAGAITSLGRNGLFSTIYTARILKRPAATFLSHIGIALAACLSLAGVGWLLAPLVKGRSWIHLGIAAAPLAIVYSLVMYFFVLDYEERQTLRKIVQSSLRLER